MDYEFQVHLRVLQYFNFNKDQPARKRDFVITLQIFNLLVNFYCLFSHGTFVALNYNNVFQISECFFNPFARLSRKSLNKKVLDGTNPVASKIILLNELF